MSIEVFIFNAILVVLILWSTFVGQYALQRCKEEELLREGNVRGANSFYLRGIIISLASIAFFAEFLIFSVVSQQGTFSICIFGGLVLYNLFLVYKALDKYLKFRKVAEFHTGGPILLERAEDLSDMALKYSLLMDCKTEKVKEDFTAESVRGQYLRACNEGKNRGFTPVFIPTFSYAFFDVIKEGRKRLGKDADAKAIVAEAVQRYLRAEVADGETVFEESFQNAKNQIDAERWEHLANDKTENADFLYDLDDFLSTDSILVKIPVKNPWDVFAYFAAFFNTDPERVQKWRGVAKYWYEKYGALPCYLDTEDVVFYIRKPIPQEALNAVAKQVFSLTTSDETIPDIESYIRNGKIWAITTIDLAFSSE